LVAKAKGSPNTFLPGGHVELGESLEATLTRELAEEIGVVAYVGRYLGAIEHGWEKAGVKNYEINHCFLLRSDELRPDEPVISRESHLEFHWLKFVELAANNLQPFPLQKLLLNLESDIPTAWWASTL